MLNVSRSVGYLTGSLGVQGEMQIVPAGAPAGSTVVTASTASGGMKAEIDFDDEHGATGDGTWGFRGVFRKELRAILYTDIALARGG